MSPLEAYHLIVFKILPHYCGCKRTVPMTPLTTLHLYGFLLLVVVFYILYVPISGMYIMPTMMQRVVEGIGDFVVSVIKQQITTPRIMIFFPLFLSVYVYILFANLIGLFPFSFTVTTYISQTFTLAFSLIIGLVLFGLRHAKYKFGAIFVPGGVPALLVYFLVLIEVASFLIRPFSLAIRLFANMLAGHTLLAIISGFVLYMTATKYGLLTIFAFMFLLSIFALEIAVAFIQSYVFVILLSVYMRDIFLL